MNFSEEDGAEPRIKVMIVEDQTAIRQMLVAMVGSLADFVVVGEAGNVADAARLANELRPDVVVLDWIFPVGCGLEFLQALKSNSQLTHVLVFSGSTSEYAVREALTGGAKGYVEKGASFTEFMEALRAVAAGGIYFGPVVAKVVERLVARPPQESGAAVLSEREREVLRCVGEGMSSREIAERLGLSVRTVTNHRANITQKTQLRSVAQLTMLAARLGLIPGPGDAVDSTAEPVVSGA